MAVHNKSMKHILSHLNVVLKSLTNKHEDLLQDQKLLVTQLSAQRMKQLLQKRTDFSPEFHASLEAQLEEIMTMSTRVDYPFRPSSCKWTDPLAEDHRVFTDSEDDAEDDDSEDQEGSG